MSSTSIAVCLALVASAAFTGAAALAKTAALTYPVLQILLFRQVFMVLTTIPGVVPNFPRSIRTAKPALNCVRVAGAFVALACDIWAVSVLPLATATVLSFSKVLLAVIFAGIILQETMRLPKLIAVVIGFLGVSFIVQPGFTSENPWLYLIPLLGASGAMVAVLSIRVLSQTESTATLLFYQGISVGIASLIPMYWIWVPPDVTGVALLISIAACSTLGQWTSTKAIQLSEISVVGPIEYTRSIYALLLGFLFFNEVPTAYAFVGTGLIVGSCLFVTIRRG